MEAAGSEAPEKPWWRLRRDATQESIESVLERQS